MKAVEEKGLRNLRGLVWLQVKVEGKGCLGLEEGGKDLMKERNHKGLLGWLADSSAELLQGLILGLIHLRI